MPKFPNLSNLDIQAHLDALVAKHAGDYVESATYLPDDAPAPADAFVLSLRSPSGEKVEVALQLKGVFFETALGVALRVL